MQGGCLCENPPGLRLDTTNVEIAATIAPRPLLMVSATGDWTRNTPQEEFPAVRHIFELYGKAENVENVHIDAPHNYNQASRYDLLSGNAEAVLDGVAVDDDGARVDQQADRGEQRREHARVGEPAEPLRHIG